MPYTPKKVMSRLGPDSYTYRGYRIEMRCSHRGTPRGGWDILECRQHPGRGVFRAWSSWEVIASWGSCNDCQRVIDGWKDTPWTGR